MKEAETAKRFDLVILKLQVGLLDHGPEFAAEIAEELGFVDRYELSAAVVKVEQVAVPVGVNMQQSDRGPGLRPVRIP